MPILFNDALKIVLKTVTPLKANTMPLAEAAGGCLARDIRADRDMPPTDRSAMDGYAIQARDVRRCPCRLELVGEARAGSGTAPTVRPGQCVRILTGAVVPRGADAVVKQEDTWDADGVVGIQSPVRRGANIRNRGENASKGAVLMAKGTILGPAQIGLAAEAGFATVRVYKRPAVAILCTGEELCAAGQRVRPHQLRDANGPALAAALQMVGCREVSCRIVPDDPDVLAKQLDQAVEMSDLVILTGGVSVGKYDFVPQVVGRLGAKVRFHGVAIKPGKPQLYATLSRNRHVFGLPGNPLSALVGFYLFVLPAIRRMMGVDADRCRPLIRLPLSRSVHAPRKRTELVLARLACQRGATRLVPLASHGSADLVSAAAADGVFVFRSNQKLIPRGALVDFIPWRPIL